MASTVTEAARARLRARRTAPAAPPWHPPALEDFVRGVAVVAFDASLLNTGWVVLRRWLGGIDVYGHGTIRPKTDATGYMATWERARILEEELPGTLAAAFLAREDIEMALEAPSVGGHRTESSLVAGLTVRRLNPGKCVPVSATHVSAVLLGDPKVKSEERKGAIKLAVARYVPESAGRDWNEHERDALSVGLTRLYDMREAA